MFMILYHLNLLMILFIPSCITSTVNNQSIFKQIRIPLNNSSGVPFYYHNNIYYLEGFEVDEKEKLYFLGGEKPRLRVFSNSQKLLSKDYSEFQVNPIKLIDDKLYIFDIEKKTLFSLNRYNGEILYQAKFNINRNINSISFLDSTIVIEYIQISNDRVKTTRIFDQYSLNGELLGRLQNPHNLPSQLYKDDSEDYYLGLYADFLVFWSLNYETFEEMILLKNKNGDIIENLALQKDLIGAPFYGNPPEHKLLRNSKIYILGHNKNEAIVTIIELKDLI